MKLIKPLKFYQEELFTTSRPSIENSNFLLPKAYTGLAGFHKYWGKKPIESISYLINMCTKEGDFILDPFLGSGLISRECLLKKRKFIGIDINPLSINHSLFLLKLPTNEEYHQAIIDIEKTVAEIINNTYLTIDGKIASHYLWEDQKLISVWTKNEKYHNRIEMKPTEYDMNLYLAYKDYKQKFFRDMVFFNNSRISVKPDMTIKNIFTGRAIRNIDIIIEAISQYQDHLKRALLLTLTSSVGQMSNMVFVIKNRGKYTNNKLNSKIEVGSWAIGYWLPKEHFEVNVWNCFKSRANKLLKILPKRINRVYSITCIPKFDNLYCYDAWIINSDCRTILKKIPSETISLICTDPPHSDRIPYLELSELWNSILNFDVDFNGEIVVSDAKDRNKSKNIYFSDMTEFFLESSRILKPFGLLALYFNARDKESWLYLKNIEEIIDSLKFQGCFPMAYSATSIVQDNRKGALKNDYIIIFQKQLENSTYKFLFDFAKIPGWSSEFPQNNK